MFAELLTLIVVLNAAYFAGICVYEIVLLVRDRFFRQVAP